MELKILPRIIADMIVQYARAVDNTQGSQVETLYKLMDGQVEALEFRVNQPVEGLTYVPLRVLAKTMKPNILIAGIIRNRKTIVPGGEDVFCPEDRVIVLASGHRLADLSDILAE